MSFLKIGDYCRENVFPPTLVKRGDRKQINYFHDQIKEVVVVETKPLNVVDNFIPVQFSRGSCLMNYQCVFKEERNQCEDLVT